MTGKLEHSYLPFTASRHVMLNGVTDDQLERAGGSSAGLAQLQRLRDGTGTLLEQYSTGLALMRSAAAEQYGSTDTAKLDGYIATDIRRVVAEYVFERAGSPTWYILPEVMWLLESVHCEARVNELRVPKGVLRICFPKPYAHDGVPCRELLVMRYSDEPIVAMVSELVKIHDTETPESMRTAYFYTSFGDSSEASEQYDWNRQGSPVAHISLEWNDMTINEGVEQSSAVLQDGGLRPAPYPAREQIALKHMIKMLAACLLYVQAEPESVQPTRRSVKGKKVKPPRGGQYVAAVKRLPKASVAMPASARSSTERYGPRPHLRSWHLRTLRNKRFKRNEDGTPKVILIDGMLVGAEDISELNVPSQSAIVGKKE